MSLASVDLNLSCSRQCPTQAAVTSLLPARTRIAVASRCRAETRPEPPPASSPGRMRSPRRTRGCATALRPAPTCSGSPPAAASSVGALGSSVDRATIARARRAGPAPDGRCTGVRPRARVRPYGRGPVARRVTPPQARARAGAMLSSKSTPVGACRWRLVRSLPAEQRDGRVAPGVVDLAVGELQAPAERDRVRARLPRRGVDVV